MIKAKKILISTICASLFINNSALACSTFTVPVCNGPLVSNVVGVRTMDFEAGASNPIGYGLKSDMNISSVDTSPAINNPTSWINKYDFVGKGMSLDGKLIEGINSAGVYIGGLYLPNITDYPNYSNDKAKKALGVFDIVNYVLGTSDSVKDALANLNSVQVVISTIRLTAGKNFMFPLHFYLTDKSGDSAVIEFIAGKMNIYSTSTGLKAAPRVLTNAPDFRWQLDNYAQVSKDFTHKNKDIKIDNMYMNGSGYLGLAGDSTPPSRFVRANTLLAASPQANNVNQANYIANMVLDSVAIVPIGFNAAPTLWSSRYNLADGVYKITNYIALADNDKFSIMPEDSKYYTHTYELDHINEIKASPVTIHSLLKKAYIPISESKAHNLMPEGTSPDASYDSKFIKARTTSVDDNAYVAM